MLYFVRYFKDRFMLTLRSLISLRWILPAAALLTAAAWWWWPRDGASERYRTQAIDRGDIVQTVTANGTLNPVVLVNVGTQISGRIRKLYVDFNHKVKAGQVLAELDQDLLRAQLEQSEANLKQAEANARRLQALFDKDYIARAENEQAQTAAAVARAQAERDRTNLQYSVIRSPVSGVVVGRAVDVGQTVAASFQSPTLFTIAQDLRTMQIDTSVAEADIGQVRVGQSAPFTVDAFPGQRFSGKVKQVRLNPTVQQNVVTYNVVVAVDNPEEKLMPGMTAHVTIQVDRKDGVLRIPNASLRFRPKAEEEEGRGEGRKRAVGSTAWRLADGAPVEVAIATGITDNRYTELTGGELKEGDRIIVQERVKKDTNGSGFRIRLF